MSATTPQQPAGLVTGGSALTRPQLFAGTIAVLLANAIATQALQAFADHGAAATLANGGGLSWAAWVGLFACLRLAAIGPPSPARANDLWLCGGCLLAAILPISQLSALACTGLALVVLIDRSQGAQLKASAMVLLALSIHLLWSRLLMLAFVQPIASFDATLVSLVVGQPAHGHEVDFVLGGHRLSILGACTSVQNASVALVLYVAIVRSFRPVPVRGELLALAGVFLSVVVANVARLALMAQDIDMYHLVHGDVGSAGINVLITLIGLAWAVASVRREILA